MNVYNIISCPANPGMVYITYETEHSGGSNASGQSIERDLIDKLPWHRNRLL